jgi:hypothetical protein
MKALGFAGILGLLVLGGCGWPLGFGYDTENRKPIAGEDLQDFIPAPEAGGGIPLSFFISSGYTGTVAWKEDELPVRGVFRAGTTYVATVTLTTAPGYTFSGVPAAPEPGSFSHSRSVELSHDAGRGAVLEIRIRFGTTDGNGQRGNSNDIR